MPTFSVRADRLGLAFLSAFLWILAFRSIHAQEPRASASSSDLEQRVQELEASLRELKTDRQKETPAVTTVLPASLKPAPSVKPLPDSAGPPLITHSVDAKAGLTPSPAAAADADSPETSGAPPRWAGWDNGFFIQSPDKRFVLRITGQIQADHRAFLDDVDFTDVDSFFIRRARLGIEANMFDYYEFRLLPDFGQGQTVIQDAYMNVHYWDAFQVEMGKLKQPFSYEQLIQDRFVPTQERSMIDQLVPARDVGIMLHGQHLFGDRLDWGIAFSNGTINGNSDTNDNKDLVGRLAVRPFACSERFPALQGLQLGVSGSTGIEQEPVSPLTLKTPAGVPWFQFNPTVRADGSRKRWSPEISYFFRSFGFATQYFRQEQDLRPAFFGAGSQYRLEIPAEGFYAMATYLLTGEERTTYSAAVVPLRDFDPIHPISNPGAWELVARVSRLDLGDQVFQRLPTGRTTFVRLADPNRFASSATELTVGFNWYLNAWVRTQFNYERAWFDDPVRLGPGSDGLLRHQDTLMTRFQVIF